MAENTFKSGGLPAGNAALFPAGSTAGTLGLRIVTLPAGGHAMIKVGMAALKKFTNIFRLWVSSSGVVSWFSLFLPPLDELARRRSLPLSFLSHSALLIGQRYKRDQLHLCKNDQ